MGFFRQEYWGRLPFPPLGDLPNSGMEAVSPAVAGRVLLLSHQGSPLLPNSTLEVRHLGLEFLRFFVDIFAILQFDFLDCKDINAVNPKGKQP